MKLGANFSRMCFPSTNFFTEIQNIAIKACDNVLSILGLLSTQSPPKKWLKLSTHDWVLNKSKFWAEIECSITAFFLYYHWVLNKSKFWVVIEYSITQFFYHLLSMEFVMNTQLLTFIVPYWVHNIPKFWVFFEYSI